MGYTHYWKIPSTDEWLKTWPQLVSDAKLIVKSCKIKLAGPDDEGEGHPQINETRTAFNGGNGNGHQPFILKSKATKFSCCKTAHKPYDLVVAAILLRASQLAGDAIRIRSDGLWDDEDEWGYVRTVVKKLWPGEEIRMPSGVRKADDDDEESDEFGSIDLEDTEDENSEDEVVALLVEATKTVNI